MRHRVKSQHLSRNKGARKAVLVSLARAVVKEQRIKTTVALAKEARRLVDRLVTFGKKGTVAARRQAFAVLNDRTLVKMLFDEIAPLFKERQGGYTRIVRLPERRKGDNAELCLLELTQYYKTVQPVSESAEESPDKTKGFLGGLRGIFKKQRRAKQKD